MKWIVVKMHDHCPECSECAANAVQHAIKTSADRAVSSYQDGMEDGAEVLHRAEVTLVEKS